ncbi:hypothetical protein TWF696_005687 [Orbilia brochopaga]|uniref:CFEM domain-containing protein n=1 Tax=Orbilia brochopaga TaxID=3140254 RepID=A0AAV9UU39_9PEZI
MYTSFVTLALLAAGPALTSAQSTAAPDGKLPSCVTTCYGLAVARASCDTLSPTCICGSNTFFNFVSNCLTTGEYTCTEAEATDIWNKLQAQCADKLSSALPSLRFRTSVSATIGSIVPDTTTETDSVSATIGIITGPDVSTTMEPTTGLGNLTVTMGTLTRTSVVSVSSVTQTTNAGPGQSSESNTQVSQTTRQPSAPTQTPSDATHLLPSIASLIVGSFMAGALFFLA